MIWKSDSLILKRLKCMQNSGLDFMVQNHIFSLDLSLLETQVHLALGSNSLHLIKLEFNFYS